MGKKLPEARKESGLSEADVVALVDALLQYDGLHLSVKRYAVGRHNCPVCNLHGTHPWCIMALRQVIEQIIGVFKRDKSRFVTIFNQTVDYVAFCAAIQFRKQRARNESWAACPGCFEHQNVWDHLADGCPLLTVALTALHMYVHRRRTNKIHKITVANGWATVAARERFVNDAPRPPKRPLVISHGICQVSGKAPRDNHVDDRKRKRTKLSTEEVHDAFLFHLQATLDTMLMETIKAAHRAVR
jgi:hypothetical protein